MDDNGSGQPKKRRNKICVRIEKYHILRGVLEQTSKHLKGYGKRRSEALVFWVGWFDEKCDAYVTTCKIPKNINWGEGVRVELDGMLGLIDELIAEDLVLLAQVHSHPGDFGHSYGDELTAASYQKGFVSIVVPNYGLIELKDLSRCYVYEYQENWRWRLLPKQEVGRRFLIESRTRP